MEMLPTKRHYFAAGLCVLFFLFVQTFQEIAYVRWIPASHGPQDDLAIYLLRIDQARALLLMGSILPLVVVYSAIALRYRKVAPLASVLGLLFGAAFVGFEIIARSSDFFVVGQNWARQFHAAASSAERDAILQRFALWNELVHGWYFPQMLSYLLASCLFAFAIVRGGGPWHRLAALAFVLNALRLLGRILATFAGQSWLSGLNDKLYFPGVFVINVLLMLWLFRLSAEEAAEPA